MQSTGLRAPMIGEGVGRRPSDVHVQAQQRYSREDGEPRLKLLIVCFGNTCRSPMAGGLVWKVAATKGHELEVQTAGLGAHRRRPVAQLAADAMREIGFETSFRTLERYLADLDPAAWDADTGVRINGRPVTIRNSIGAFARDYDNHRRRLEE